VFDVTDQSQGSIEWILALAEPQVEVNPTYAQRSNVTVQLGKEPSCLVDVPVRSDPFELDPLVSQRYERTFVAY
jgi:hypothetical protein